MKIEINESMKRSISSWNNLYQNAILIYEWPQVVDRLKDVKFDFDMPEDIRITLLSIHPNHFGEIIFSKKLTEWLGDSSMYELLTGTSKYDYTLKEGQDLVKWYLINYTNFMYR